MDKNIKANWRLKGPVTICLVKKSFPQLRSTYMFSFEIYSLPQQTYFDRYYWITSISQAEMS